MRTFVCVAALAAVVVAGPAFAATPAATDTANATAKGTVLQAHQLVKSTDLNFGVVTVSSAAGGGTVTITSDAAGTQSVSGGVTSLSGVSSSAVFLGQAAPLETVQLTLNQPANGTLKNTNNANITIPAALTMDATSAAGPIVTDSTGQFTVYVGGTFTLAPSQAAGVYSETFSVRADYQ
jgi:outer membrane protein assembly factor BamB